MKKRRYLRKEIETALTIILGLIFITLGSISDISESIGGVLSIGGLIGIGALILKILVNYGRNFSEVK